MDVCILPQDGESLVHRNMPAGPEPCLKAVAPSRSDLGVCVACLFPWDWRADLCARDGRPFGLGPALSRQALHGGKANNDSMDAPNIAALLRGGMRPQAYGSPAARRAPRALRRRRLPLLRKRAALLTHGQPTNRPDPWPEIGKQSAATTNRPGGAARFAEPAVPTSGAVARARLAADDQLLRDLAWAMVKTAQQPEAHTLYGLQPVPGLGTRLRLGLVYERHDLARVPRGQACVS